MESNTSSNFQSTGSNNDFNSITAELVPHKTPTPVQQDEKSSISMVSPPMMKYSDSLSTASTSHDGNNDTVNNSFTASLQDSDMMRTTILGVSADDLRLLGPTKMDFISDSGKTKRTSFACVNCHSLKQKCVPSDIFDIYRKPCRRCLRQGKKCTFDLSKRTRKRRSKRNPDTSGDSIDSERKIEASPASSPSCNFDNSRISKERGRIDVPSNFRVGPRNLITNGLTMRNRHESKAAILNLITSTSNEGTITSQSPNFLQEVSPSPSYPQNVVNVTDATDTPLRDGSQSNTGPFNVHEQPITAVAHPSDLSNPSQVSYIHSLPRASDTGNSTAPDIVGLQSKAGHLYMLLENNDPNSRKFGRSNSNPSIGRARVSTGETMRTLKLQLQALLETHRDKASRIANDFNIWSQQFSDDFQLNDFPMNVSNPITAGILTRSEAELRLQAYKDNMINCEMLPFIYIPKEASAEQLFSEKPILATVIMSIASVMMHERDTTRETVIKLNTFLLTVIMNHVFKFSTKSIEIIEAHILLGTWYNFLDWTNKARYHLFNYMCCCLTQELVPKPFDETFAVFADDAPIYRELKLKSPLEVDQNGPRLILLVYIISLNTSIFLKETIQVRWSKTIAWAFKEMERRIKEQMDNLDGKRELKTEEQAKMTEMLQFDSTLLVFIKLNKVLEKIHIHLHRKEDFFGLTGEEDEGEEEEEEDNGVRNNPTTDELAKLRDRYTMRLFDKYESELTQIFLEIPGDKSRLFSFYYCIKAYLLFFKVQNFGDKYSMLPEGDDVNREELKNKICDTFMDCYNCCIQSLKIFVAMAPRSMAVSPVFHVSRLIFTVGMLLLKLRFAVIAVPVLHHLLENTEEAMPLVVEVATLLDNSSEIYPYNYSLHKFRYVLSLFFQTYAKMIISLMEGKNSSQNPVNNPTKVILGQELQFNPLLIRLRSTSMSGEPDTNQNWGDQVAGGSSAGFQFPQTSTDHANGETMGVPEAASDNGADRTTYHNVQQVSGDLSGDGGPNYTQKDVMNTFHQTKGTTNEPVRFSDPFATTTVGNAAEGLANANSLAWCYNALGGEFWSEFFGNGI